MEYHVTPNENQGKDTLHGGLDGWDYVRYPFNCYVEWTTLPSGRAPIRGVRWDLLTCPQRNFTVVAHTTDSITFSIVDPDGKEGFPGEVVSYITYTMTPNTWHIKMVALATTKKTPIMLSSHVRDKEAVQSNANENRLTGISTDSRILTHLRHSITAYIYLIQVNVWVWMAFLSPMEPFFQTRSTP